MPDDPLFAVRRDVDRKDAVVLELVTGLCGYRIEIGRLQPIVLSWFNVIVGTNRKSRR